MQTRPTGSPEPRSVASWTGAEINAVDWLRWLGHPDAGRTTGGAGDGVDVRGAGMAARVQCDGAPVGDQALRELLGAAQHAPGERYCFSDAGFTRDAVSFADDIGMALFTFSTVDGLITPANEAATVVFRASPGRPRPQSTATTHARPRTPPLPGWVRVLGAVPFVMFVLGLLFLAVLRAMTDTASDAMADLWAGWMTVAVLGAAGVGIVALIRKANDRS
ncbi:hypothetical protein [Dactylosporangium sp. NPDC006015]|uniref:hypothetical protein n=1 Tax=Dactylosporangium sp. NPDC006015 TaxID=3154576 RepID=UPI0033B07CC2